LPNLMLAMKIGKIMPNYVYIFDCVYCREFYGEQSLTIDGKLYCPNCLNEVDTDSPFVEQMAVDYPATPFSLEGAY
jgi:hypothetical protein